MDANCFGIELCRICDSPELSTVLHLGSTPPANAFLTAEQLKEPEPSFPLEVVLCERCGSVQLRHTVDPKILFENYLYESSTSASFRKHFEDYATDIVERFELKEGDIVYDVGSNDGILLKPLREKKIRAIGIEPATNLATKCRENGFEVINDFFGPKIETRLKEIGPAKVITANNVFAHAHDLHEILETVKAALDTGGVFVFEVQYLLDLYEKKYFDLWYHEHIYGHGVTALKTLLQRHDFKIIDVQRIKTHGGSIRVYTKRAFGQYECYSRVIKALIEEDEAGLLTKAGWELFYASIERNKVALVDLVKKIKAEGKTIYGYGYPAKTTTLLHYYGLTTNEITAVVDDSPAKQGKFSPGLHIPIISSEEFYAANPDYCIVLAWNFFDQITNGNKSYKGQWIHPTQI